MSRELTSQFLSEAMAAVCRPVLLFEGDFNGSWVRLWNGQSDLTIIQNSVSVTYSGNGWMQSITGGEEKCDMGASSAKLELSGVPSSVLSLMLTARQNAKGNFYLGFLDANGDCVDSPYLFFSGALDTVSLRESPESPSVLLGYSSALNDTERAKNYKFTTETQKLFYPTDRGFEYVLTVSDQRQIFWGPQPKEAKKK